ATPRGQVRTGRPTTPNPPSDDDVDRPALPRSSQPAPTARTLAILHRDTGDADCLASAVRSEAVDVCAQSRTPAVSPGDPRAGAPARARQPAMGLSTHRR